MPGNDREHCAPTKAQIARASEAKVGAFDMKRAAVNDPAKIKVAIDQVPVIDCKSDQSIN
jgi:hypothetical protein